MLLMTSVGMWVQAQMSTIKGTVKPGSVRYKTIELMRIENGEGKTIATTEIASDGTYGFLFKPSYEGFYAVGANSIMEGQFPVYLKPGDNAELHIDDVYATFKGMNTPENQTLGQWQEQVKEVRFISIFFNKSRGTYVDFYPALESALGRKDAFKASIKTPNSTFNTLMTKTVDVDMDFYALNFLSTPRTAHPDSTFQKPEFYRHIAQKEKFKDDDVLKNIFAKRFLGMYGSYVRYQLKVEDDKELMGYFGTDAQRAVYVMDQELRSIRSHDQYTAFVTRYGQYITAPQHRTQIDDIGAKLYESRVGAAASDFTYPDQDGKLVSLSGQKGKVVLIDVWATWCGPCKVEIPHLKKLEAEMEGKDVVIISVSIDEEKDKEKWKKMIKDEGLGGLQLFAGGWNSKITKDYKITGIPRFMVFDKQGNIVTIDAPRPSSPELKALLEKELKKK